MPEDKSVLIGTLQDLCIDIIYERGGPVDVTFIQNSLNKLLPMRSSSWLNGWPCLTDYHDALAELQARGLTAYSQGNHYLAWAGRNYAKKNRNKIDRLMEGRKTGVFKAKIRSTKQTVLVRDFGCLFSPRWWSSTEGYYHTELDFTTLSPVSINDPNTLLGLI